MLKFNRPVGNQYLSAPDAAGLTFPNGNWVMSWVVSFIGATSGDQPQYFFSNANFQAAGSLNVAYNTLAAASNQGKMLVYSGTGAAPIMVSANPYSSGVHLMVLQRNGTTLTLRSCPILTTEPTDGSAVIAEVSTTLSTALDGAGFKIGGRNDLLAARFNDQALGRMFRYDGTLTDLEVAQLAWGKQINELGYTPAWYIRMTDNTDYADLGSQANVITMNGAIASSAEPSYGYTGGVTPTVPDITSNPIIIGTPQVGVASSYTVGPSTGEPAPARTQQWTIDGTDVSGATGTTYTPVTGDAGKALRVRQIATNTSGSDSATSSPATVTAASVSNTIDCTDLPFSGKQRIAGVASWPLVGTYVGDVPTTIEAQLYAADGSTILVAWYPVPGLTIGGGNFSGNLVVPAGGRYRLRVRSVDGVGSQLAQSAVKTNTFVVGDAYINAGSSSSEKFLNVDSGSGKVSNPNNIRLSETGFAVMGTFGVGVDFANSLSTSLGVPIISLDFGIGGTTLAQWISNAYVGYTRVQTAVALVGGAVAFGYWSGGSNDAATNIVVSQAQHQADLQTMFAKFRALSSQPFPMVVSGTNGRGPVNDMQFQMVREAEKAVGKLTNNVYVQTLDLTVSGDNIHLTPDLPGFGTSALRAEAAITPSLIAATPRTGPRITAFTFIGSTIFADVAIGTGGATDITPASGITGFVATDNSGALTITSAVRSAANMITIEVNRAIVAPLNIDYLPGSRPVITGAVKDNGAVPFPMELETLMTATAAAIETEAPVYFDGSVQIAKAEQRMTIATRSIVPVYRRNSVRLQRNFQNT